MLPSAGESTAYVESHVSDVSARWAALSELVQSTSTKLRLASDSKRFYDDFHGLREIVGAYERWIDAQAPQVAGELLEICRQQEQCRVSSGGRGNRGWGGVGCNRGIDVPALSCIQYFKLF